MMNIEKTNNKSYSSWKKLLLKDFCKKCIVKNTDKKHSLVFTNSAIYGIVKQADYFEKDVANSDNTDSYYVVNTKDFIYNPRISENAPYGPIRTNETGEVGIVSPLYFVFRIADETIADYNFLKYYFTSSNWHRYVYSIGNNGARSDRMNISDADFMAMPVALPPLEEQRWIAEILGCCDRVIALKKELIAEKKKQKKSLMQKLLNPDSGFRLPGFSGEWQKTKMENIAPLQRGFDLPNSQLRQGKFPVVYSNGAMAFHNEFMVTAPGVVTGRSGTIGAVFYIEKNFWPHNTSLWVTNFFNNIPLFVYHLYQFIDIEKCASGSGVPTLNRNDVHKIEISIPSEKDEQQAIADILSAADKEIDLLEQELDQQEQKKKSLMQLLLTGIVRV